MSVVIGTLLVIATMRVGRAFVMPVVIAVLLTLMLPRPYAGCSSSACRSGLPLRSSFLAPSPSSSA